MRPKITVISERLDKSNDEDKPHLGPREFFMRQQGQHRCHRIYTSAGVLCVELEVNQIFSLRAAVIYENMFDMSC